MRLVYRTPSKVGKCAAPKIEGIEAAITVAECASNLVDGLAAGEKVLQDNSRRHPLLLAVGRSLQTVPSRIAMGANGTKTREIRASHDATPILYVGPPGHS